MSLKDKTIKEIEMALKKVGAPESRLEVNSKVAMTVTDKAVVLVDTLYGMGHNEPHIYSINTYKYTHQELFPEDFK